MTQLSLVEVRPRWVPLADRQRCFVGDCENAVELTSKGYERKHCWRHRGSWDKPGTGGQPPRYDVEGRPRCAVAECCNLVEIKWLPGEGSWSFKTLCYKCRRRLSAGERAVYRRPRQLKGRIVGNDGYARVRQGDGSWIREHRLVLARVLGRDLLPSETVHHINGVRADNRPENLQLRSSNHGSGQTFCCADCGSRNVKAVEL